MANLVFSTIYTTELELASLVPPDPVCLSKKPALFVLPL